MKIEITTEKCNGLKTCDDCPISDKCGLVPNCVILGKSKFCAEPICETLGVPEDEHIIGIKIVEQ